jgi:outer membrane immunogenic protein
MKRVAFAAAVIVFARSAALAADLPPPAGRPDYIPPPIPVYNWSGFYLGGNVGVGWQNGSFSDPFGNTFNATNSATFLGGGQAGVNYEFNSGVVVGTETDFDWLGNGSNTTSPFPLAGTGIVPAPTASVTANNQWLLTVTGRVGYAWDRLLVYGKAGGAWVGNNPTIMINGTGFSFSGSNANFGWTAGAGVEWAFWGNWSARLEYDYVGLASETLTVPTTSIILPGDVFGGSNRNIQMMNVGINYKIGGW